MTADEAAREGRALTADEAAREVFDRAAVAQMRADPALALEVCAMLGEIQSEYHLVLKTGLAARTPEKQDVFMGHRMISSSPRARG